MLSTTEAGYVAVANDLKEVFIAKTGVALYVARGWCAMYPGIRIQPRWLATRAKTLLRTLIPSTYMHSIISSVKR